MLGWPTVAKPSVVNLNDRVERLPVRYNCNIPLLEEVTLSVGARTPQLTQHSLSPYSKRYLYSVSDSFY